MLRIVKSFLTIAIVPVVATGATGAYFSSTASITDNTFSTGVLEIRVNGQPSVVGATFSPAVPGEVYYSPEYHINNYGPDHFAGPSNLAAKYLAIRVNNAVSTPDNDLWDNVRIKVETNRGWETWQEVYNGKLKYMPVSDLLAPRWTELAAGDSQMLRYEVWLPESGDQNNMMGESLVWNFVIEGRTN